VRLAASPRRLDLTDRRTQLGLGLAVVALLGLSLAYAIGSGDFKLAALLGGLVLAPPLLVLAARRPYLFPYGLYVILVPFDNMLRIGGAGTLTKLLGMAAAGFLVLRVLRERRIGREPLAVYFGLAYMAWLLLSILWAPDLAAASLEAQSMVSLILLYAIFAVAPVDERELRGIVACVVIGGVVASIYGISLLHAGAVNEDYGRLAIDVDNRVIDPNHFANSLLAPLALALVGLLRARKPAALLAYGGAVAIIAAGQLISLSREALLGSVLVGAVLIAFSKRRLLGAAIGLPVIALLPFAVPAIGQRMLELSKTGGAGRSFIWHIVWRAVQQHPLFGWGAGGAIEAYDRNYLAVYALVHQLWGRPPHNTPLHILVELGVVGLVLATLAFATTFRQFAGIRYGDGLYDLRVALTAALVALGFVSLFIDMANYKYLWLVLVAVAQLRTVARSRLSVPG
jgi:O-antigen ligase